MENKCKFYNEAYIAGNHKSMTMEILRKITEQSNCTCKIIEGNTRGTGFFCRIPFPDNKN